MKLCLYICKFLRALLSSLSTLLFFNWILLNFCYFTFHGVRLMQSQQCWHTQQLKTQPKHHITSNNSIAVIRLRTNLVQTQSALEEWMYVCGVRVRLFDLIVFVWTTFFSSIDKKQTPKTNKNKTNKTPTKTTSPMWSKLFLFFCQGAICEVIDLSYVCIITTCTVQHTINTYTSFSFRLAHVSLWIFSFSFFFHVKCDLIISVVCLFNFYCLPLPLFLRCCFFAQCLTSNVIFFMIDDFNSSMIFDSLNSKFYSILIWLEHTQKK